jgi:hypothetical protein
MKFIVRFQTLSSDVFLCCTDYGFFGIEVAVYSGKIGLKTHTFYCESEEQRQEWLKHLNRARRKPARRAKTGAQDKSIPFQGEWNFHRPTLLESSSNNDLLDVVTAAPGNVVGAVGHGVTQLVRNVGSGWTEAEGKGFWGGCGVFGERIFKGAAGMVLTPLDAAFDAVLDVGDATVGVGGRAIIELVTPREEQDEQPAPPPRILRALGSAMCTVDIPADGTTKKPVGDRNSIKVFYTIKVTGGTEEWAVERRYSEFERLHKQLLISAKEQPFLKEFPAKNSQEKWGWKWSEHQQTKKRQQQFNKYIKQAFAELGVTNVDLVLFLSQDMDSDDGFVSTTGSIKNLAVRDYAGPSERERRLVITQHELSAWHESVSNSMIMFRRNAREVKQLLLKVSSGSAADMAVAPEPAPEPEPEPETEPETAPETKLDDALEEEQMYMQFLQKFLPETYLCESEDQVRNETLRSLWACSNADQKLLERYTMCDGGRFIRDPERVTMHIEESLRNRELLQRMDPEPDVAPLPTFANSHFKKAYVSKRKVTKAAEAMTFVGDFVFAYCNAHGLTSESEKAHAESFVDKLQRTTANHEHGEEQLLGDLGATASLLWTSPEVFAGMDSDHTKELCSLLNAALRDDRSEFMGPAAAMVRAINDGLCTKNRHVSTDDEIATQFPPGGELARQTFGPGTTFRGTGFDDAHRDFFVPGKKYRVPGFLATSFNPAVAVRFAAKAAQVKPRPHPSTALDAKGHWTGTCEKSSVLWVVHVDPEGQHNPEKCCRHVNFVGQHTHVRQEKEYLFAAYSTFTVRSVKWCDDGGPSIAELDAALDNRDEPEDLPLAQWY